MDNNKKKFKIGAFIGARLTSTISISLLLFILGIIALLGVVGSKLANYVRENMTVSVILSDAMQDTELKRIQKKLDKALYVKEWNYISKKEALNALIDELGENPEDFIGFNPLQASIEIKLHATYATNDSLEWINKQLLKQPKVRDVVYQKDMINLINDNIRRISTILLLISTIFMIISFALINNTVRLNAYAKRFTVHTMKLVGATPGFIRRPFIIDTIINGIMAAIIAIILLSGCVYYMGSEIENISTVINTPTLLIVYGIIIFLGIVITGISAFFAVNRYIRMDRDNMYEI